MALQKSNAFVKYPVSGCMYPASTRVPLRCATILLTPSHACFFYGVRGMGGVAANSYVASHYAFTLHPLWVRTPTGRATTDVTQPSSSRHPGKPTLRELAAHLVRPARRASELPRRVPLRLDAAAYTRLELTAAPRLLRHPPRSLLTHQQPILRWRCVCVCYACSSACARMHAVNTQSAWLRASGCWVLTGSQFVQASSSADLQQPVIKSI